MYWCGQGNSTLGPEEFHQILVQGCYFLVPHQLIHNDGYFFSTTLCLFFFYRIIGVCQFCIKKLDFFPVGPIAKNEFANKFSRCKNRCKPSLGS